MDRELDRLDKLEKFLGLAKYPYEFPCSGDVLIKEIAFEVEWRFDVYSGELLSLILPKIYKVLLHSSSEKNKDSSTLDRELEWKIREILISNNSIKNTAQKITKLLSNYDLPVFFKKNIVPFSQHALTLLSKIRFIRSVVRSHEEILNFTDITSYLSLKNYDKISINEIENLNKELTNLKEIKIVSFETFTIWLDNLNNLFIELYKCKEKLNTDYKVLPKTRGSILFSGKQTYKKSLIEASYYWFKVMIEKKNEKDELKNNEEFKNVLDKSIFYRIEKFVKLIEFESDEVIFNYLNNKAKPYLNKILEIDNLTVNMESGLIYDHKNSWNIKINNKPLILESSMDKVSKSLKEKLIQALKIQTKIEYNLKNLNLSVENNQEFFNVRMDNFKATDLNKIIKAIQLL